MKLSIESNGNCCLGQYSFLPCVKDHEEIFNYTEGYLWSCYFVKTAECDRHDHHLIKKNTDHYIVRCAEKDAPLLGARLIDSSVSLF